MKKILTILSVLISLIGYSQQFDFSIRGGAYKRMTVYDSTAVANSIAAKADNLANFYLKDSSLSSDRIVGLNGHSFQFKDGSTSLYFDSDSFSLDNGSLSTLLLVNSVPTQERSTIGSMSSETSGAGSFLSTYSNSADGYRFYNYASDGSNFVNIIGNAATQSLEFKGKMILQTVTSGATTDSVLTLNASTGQVYRRAASSFGNAGTVTNVAALTLGTTGTDLSSSVANSTTTPVITLNVPTASASNRGALSSTDWSTFNSKESALTFTLGLNRTVNTVKVDTADASILSRQRAALTYAPISITGTVTSVATGLGLSGGTITTSGTLLVDTSSASILSRQRAAATYLTIANSDTSKTNIYTALAGKQTALSGTGLVSFSGTTPSYNTTSLSILNIISDETGSGAMTFATTPTFTTNITTPLVIGGTGTTQSLTYKTTTGTGTTGADHIFQVGTNGATEAMRILNSGNVGIGVTNPAYPLAVAKTMTVTTGFSNYIMSVNNTISPASPGAVADYGALSIIASVGNSNAPSTSRFIYGANLSAINSSTGTIGNMYGIDAAAGQSAASGTVTTAIANRSSVYNLNGSITNFYAYRGGTKIFPAGTAVITNAYGLYIDDISYGTTLNYAIYSAGGTNYFGGNVGIGQATPTAFLHLKAGTATINTAPLKLTAGTNLTTAEVGAVEYDGTEVYSTNSTALRGTVVVMRGQSSSAGTLTLAYTYTDYIFTGTTSTWTAPAVIANYFHTFYLKNAGSGSITLNSSAGGNDFYTTALTNSVTITTGSAIILRLVGSIFYVE